MRILTLDIETSPATAFVWGLRKVYIDPRHVIEQPRMLCFAAKWHDQRGIIYRSENKSRHDMLNDLWALLDEADAVVHYNGKSFDIPAINTEFLLEGMGPPSPFVHIDLWRTVRSEFRFLSNKLDNVARLLDIGQKSEHEGMGLWIKCLAGDAGAWRRMERYNRQDVKLTEALYDELLPWIKGHPSFNLVTGTSHSCPTCGSTDVQKRGYYRTKVSTFQRYQCNECGSYSRSGKRLAGVDLRAV